MKRQSGSVERLFHFETLGRRFLQSLFSLNTNSEDLRQFGETGENPPEFASLCQAYLQEIPVAIEELYEGGKPVAKLLGDRYRFHSKDQDNVRFYRDIELINLEEFSEALSSQVFPALLFMNRQSRRIYDSLPNVEPEIYQPIHRWNWRGRPLTLRGKRIDFWMQDYGEPNPSEVKACPNPLLYIDDKTLLFNHGDVFDHDWSLLMMESHFGWREIAFLYFDRLSVEDFRVRHRPKNTFTSSFKSGTPVEELGTLYKRLRGLARMLLAVEDGSIENPSMSFLGQNTDI